MVIDGRNALQIWVILQLISRENGKIVEMEDRERLGCTQSIFKGFRAGLFERSDLAVLHYLLLLKPAAFHGDKAVSMESLVFLKLRVGLGEGKGKSATNAIKVDRLEGFHVASVSCGLGHTLLLVSRNDPQFAELKVIGGVAENVAQFTEKVGKRKRETDEVVVKKK